MDASRVNKPRITSAPQRISTPHKGSHGFGHGDADLREPARAKIGRVEKFLNAFCEKHTSNDNSDKNCGGGSFGREERTHGQIFSVDCESSSIPSSFQCRQLCRSFFQNHLRREVRALSSRNPRPTNHIRDCSRFCETLNLRQEILLLPYPCCRVEKLIDTQTVFWGISADRRKHGH